jgi:Holliday junction DNA helicase RuvB
LARIRHDDGPREDSGDELEDTRASERAEVLRPTVTGEDARIRIDVRPKRFVDYVGQRALLDKLQVYVAAARQRGEALDHVLFHGPPGLGKTTLAQILAAELGVRLHVTSGPAVENKGILAGLLTGLEDGDLLFIDEIHRLSPAVEEILYSAMEDGRIDLPMGEGARARTVGFALPPFTLVGATTRTALLGAPLRDRFHIVEGLEFYPDEDLAEIVDRVARKLGLPATRDGALEIGRRSRGTPRIAIRLTRRVRDFAQVAGREAIAGEDARVALDREGVDAAGLDRLDREVLRVLHELFQGGPAGVESIAASLGMPRDTLEDVHEPFLLQRGFLVRTPRGRMLTRKAARHLGVPLEGLSLAGGGPGGASGFGEQGELPIIVEPPTDGDVATESSPRGNGRGAGRGTSE